MRQADTPKPIRARPRTSSSIPSLTAKRVAPAAASRSSRASTRWGGKRSSSTPKGNWKAAKVRK